MLVDGMELAVLVMGLEQPLGVSRDMFPLIPVKPGTEVEEMWRLVPALGTAYIGGLEGLPIPSFLEAKLLMMLYYWILNY